MTVLIGRHGTWLNQYAKPKKDLFLRRARQVEYVVIKYGMRTYEQLCHQEGILWVAERMAESGEGTQDGPRHGARFAQELADQANQPGCVAAVINLEEADGGWHTDDGNGTRQLVTTFRSKTAGQPLFASLDTRGNRPNYPYQRVCAELCDGVMPMVYPGAFGQPAATAFKAALTPLMRERWKGKEIIPTYQTYTAGNVDVGAEVDVLHALSREGVIAGANSYTLGHATEAQWAASLAFRPVRVQPSQPAGDLADALVAIARAWREGWTAIAERGTVAEAAAYADYWRKLVGE
jgi:hypothetical protein